MTIKKQYTTPTTAIEVFSVESSVLTMSNVSGSGSQGNDAEHGDARPRGTGYSRQLSDPKFGSLW